jgi:hypothetical protein
MSDIPSYGKQRDDGIRAAGVREPNFPPNYTAGQADADWSSDLLDDPQGTAKVGMGWGTPVPRTDEV